MSAGDIPDDDLRPDAPRGRFVAVAVAAAGLAALIYAALSTAWLVTGSGTGLGLRTYETCSQYGCDRKPIGEVVAALDRAGQLTWVSIWVAVAGLGIAILPMIVGVRLGVARVASRLGVLALVAALGGAVWFVMSRPGTTAGQSTYSLSLGFWVFCAGDIVAMTAGQLLAKLHLPADPS